jgi:hypothetical protein
MPCTLNFTFCHASKKKYAWEEMGKEFKRLGAIGISRELKILGVSITLQIVLHLGKSIELSLSELARECYKLIIESYNHNLSDNYGHRE